MIIYREWREWLNPEIHNKLIPCKGWFLRFFWLNIPLYIKRYEI